MAARTTFSAVSPVESLRMSIRRVSKPVSSHHNIPVSASGCKRRSAQGGAPWWIARSPGERAGGGAKCGKSRPIVACRAGGVDEDAASTEKRDSVNPRTEGAPGGGYEARSSSGTPLRGPGAHDLPHLRPSRRRHHLRRSPRKAPATTRALPGLDYDEPSRSNGVRTPAARSDEGRACGAGGRRLPWFVLGIAFGAMGAAFARHDPVAAPARRARAETRPPCDRSRSSPAKAQGPVTVSAPSASHPPVLRRVEQAVPRRRDGGRSLRGAPRAPSRRGGAADGERRRPAARVLPPPPPAPVVVHRLRVAVNAVAAKAAPVGGRRAGAGRRRAAGHQPGRRGRRGDAVARGFPSPARRAEAHGGPARHGDGERTQRRDVSRHSGMKSRRSKSDTSFSPSASMASRPPSRRSTSATTPASV